MLRLFLSYQFWLAEICMCHKPRPTRDETRDLLIAPPRTLMLPFFSILSAFHTHDTFALVLNFEVGHFARHFLLLSLFLLLLQWKEFISHSFVVTFHCNPSSGSPPFFLSSWGQLMIHVDNGCSSCIYITLLVISLNDDPRFAQRR